jgi:hypothetical protein
VHRHPRSQHPANDCRALPSCFVAIEHQHDTIKVVGQEADLTPRDRRAHQRDHRIPGLMDRDRIEEAFEDEHGARMRCGSS